jgi:hypothetical protein
MFDEILRREMSAMLSRVAEGEGLDVNYLMSTYLPVDITPATVLETKEKAAPKKRAAKVTVTGPGPSTTKCTAVTAKGKPCSLKAITGGCMCRVHAKASEKPPAPVHDKVPRPPASAPVKKAKKVKKTEQPKHTHDLDEETHDDCELCQTHGSAMADTDDEEEFETVKSPPRTLRERLAKIATKEEYEDEDEED